MKIIHTSDWHLGNRLLGNSRKQEYQQFLDWLLVELKREQADALLISGDIFDNGTPGDAVRKMYCDFLSRADATGCRHIIITAGNHDSVAQLEVTRPLLERYRCTLVSHLTHDTAESCLIPLTDAAGRECALVCAVPYLRVADVALPAEADDEEGRRTAYTRGIAQLYAAVGEKAAAWQSAHPGCPVIGMGHLSVSGVIPTASTHNIVGTLYAVEAGMLPAVFNYTALGHIHRPTEDPAATCRYSGSPLAMGMDEGAYPHSLCVVETQGTACTVRQLPVPAFTQMVQRRCRSEEELHACAAELRAALLTDTRPLWLELIYAGGDLSLSAVSRYLEEQLPETRVPVRLVRKDAAGAVCAAAPAAAEEAITLEHYTPQHLFERRMAEYAAEHPELTAEKQTELAALFLSLLTRI